MQNIDFASCSDEELLQIREDAFTEMERRSFLKQTPKLIEEIVTKFKTLNTDDEVLKKVPSGGVAPGQKIEAKDGKVYYNDTMSWLPVGPDEYLIGYRMVEPPEAESIKPWVVNEFVGVKEIRRFGNDLYAVVQAHRTQNGWEPPNVPALWTLM